VACKGVRPVNHYAHASLTLKMQFQFRMTPALSKKPMLSRTDPGRSKPQGGPFINPDPEFIVNHVGSEHTLLMNKYCVLRPMLVLHTNAYQPQSSDLDSTDLTAAWNVLNALTPQYMVIYNRGVDSGSSQGHKHMQVFPKEEGLELFPDRAVLAPGVFLQQLGWLY
jgi:ATP adenylyltransferase